MNLNDHILLWSKASLNVLDIRHAVLEPMQELRSYQLPASAFLFANRGSARITLDGLDHSAEHCYLCHAGKGAFLDITLITEPLDYYLIFYKAVLPSPARTELAQLLERTKPFQMQFGFPPLHHAPIYLKISRMEQVWQQSGALEKLHTKSLFYQLICELLGQLHAQDIKLTVPSLVSQAIRYMDEYYGEPITLETLSAMLQCSPRQLQRQFKSQFQTSPIDYLIQVRMQRAKQLLIGTDASLKAISEAVGYPDSYYFSRIFKKHAGLSPTSFKLVIGTDGSGRHNPSSPSQYPIAAKRLRQYSGRGDDENHYQYRDGGIFPMYRPKSFKAGWTVSLLLSLTLLLAACAGTPAASSNTGSGGASQAGNVTAQPAATDATAQEITPKTIKHMKGEYLLEETPQRVVVLDTQFMDQMIALGGQPTGSVITESGETPFPSYIANNFEDVVQIGTRDEPNLEAIIEINPDIIICTEFQDKIYEDLSKIAPTIMLDRNENWQKTALTFGQMMDKEQEAQQLVNDYNNKISELKAQLSEKLKGETVALIRPRDGIVRLHNTAHRTAAILYSDLGLTPPPLAVDAKNTSASLSLEIMPELNADHLFLLSDKTNLALTTEFQNTSIWKNLKAVQNDHVYTADTSMWISYYGPVAINLVVDQIAEILNSKSQS